MGGVVGVGVVDGVDYVCFDDLSSTNLLSAKNVCSPESGSKGRGGHNAMCVASHSLLMYNHCVPRVSIPKNRSSRLARLLLTTFDIRTHIMQDRIIEALKSYRELFTMYRRIGLDKTEADAAARAACPPELNINKIFPIPNFQQTSNNKNSQARLEKKLLQMISSTDWVVTGVLCNRCRPTSKEDVISALDGMVKNGEILTSEWINPTNNRPVTKYRLAL
jgi:hypothetical protein